jgi:hypothetical protein
MPHCIVKLQKKKKKKKSIGSRKVFLTSGIGRIARMSIATVKFNFKHLFIFCQGFWSTWSNPICPGLRLEYPKMMIPTQTISMTHRKQRAVTINLLSNVRHLSSWLITGRYKNQGSTHNTAITHDKRNIAFQLLMQSTPSFWPPDCFSLSEFLIEQNITSKESLDKKVLFYSPLELGLCHY